MKYEVLLVPIYFLPIKDFSSRTLYAVTTFFPRQTKAQKEVDTFVQISYDLQYYPYLHQVLPNCYLVCESIPQGTRFRGATRGIIFWIEIQKHPLPFIRRKIMLSLILIGKRKIRCFLSNCWHIYLNR